jgi:hypothetical protein
MLSRRVLAAAFVLAATTVLPARQSAGVRSGMGPEDTGSGDIRGNQETPFQLFANRLKLDSKTQTPAAVQMFQDTARDAQQVAQQILGLRQQLVNASLGNKDSEFAAARQEYAQTETKMVGFELHAFTSVYSTLKSNQQSGGTEAFALIAGIFQVPAPEMRRGGGGGSSGGRGRGGDARLETNGSTVSFAQRGGGRGGGQASGPVYLTRFEILESALKLDKTQEKPIKAILDASSKDAAPIRDQMTKTRAAVAQAAMAGKPQPEIDSAVTAYADQTAAMAALEMKTLAQVVDSVNKDQMANASGIQTAFYLMRGMFLEKNWDDIPGTRSY